MNMRPFSTLLIVGMGKSGQALFDACVKKQIPFFCFDDRKPEAPFLTKEATLALIEQKQNDLFVVVSPGVAPSHDVVSAALRAQCRLGTDIDVALELYERDLPPFLGVTGTNGKTTVVEFCAYALEQAGVVAETVGNIGLPLVSRLILDTKPLPEVFVIELSSFQLEYTTHCPLRAAAYMNFAPDHLDWHETLEAYHRAKASIAMHVAPEGKIFVHSLVPQIHQENVVLFSASMNTALGTDGTSVFYQGSLLGKLPASLEGKLLHDTENFIASVGLLSCLGLSYEQVVLAWTTFQKGPHRIELVRTFDGVSFWDDSKATNISSTEAAVRTIQGPIVLLAGGVHKGFSYASWKRVFQGRVCTIVAIGQAKEAIYQDMAPEYPVVFAASLQEAVALARERVPRGGHVLLSPGCSSFDMFSDYKDRGNQFQSIVKKLI